jgi:hypothetical protein
VWPCRGGSDTGMKRGRRSAVATFIAGGGEEGGGPVWFVPRRGRGGGGSQPDRQVAGVRQQLSRSARGWRACERRRMGERRGLTGGPCYSPRQHGVKQFRTFSNLNG